MHNETNSADAETGAADLSRSLQERHDFRRMAWSSFVDKTLSWSFRGFEALIPLCLAIWIVYQEWKFRNRVSKKAMFQKTIMKGKK